MRSKLNETTFTKESYRMADVVSPEDIGMLKEGLIMAVVTDRHGRPEMYGLMWARDMWKKKLVKRYKKRNTFIKVRLTEIPLVRWDGKKEGLGVVDQIVPRMPAVGAVLREIAEWGV